MADPAHAATDEILNRLERRLKREYTQAAREVQKKLDDYLAAFKIKDAEWRRRVADGEATQKEYKNWRTGQLMMGKRWGQLQQECAENLANANQIAHSIAYGYQSEVYALNHNFATYEIEHSGRLDTAYTLYDKDTVARLMRDDPDMLPPPGKTVKERIAQGKDVLWNKQQLQSVMMQAIVQGESIDKIAKRMSEAVATSDYKAAVRYARTMTTNTQNAGRYEGYRRAKGMGVDLTIEWSATLDNRTRHDHRLLHGQRREVDEPFEVDNVKILYPAQLGVGSSDIPQSMIWNCRCTLLAWVKGFEGETVKSSPKMGDMTFEEWQNMKEDDPRYKAERYKKGDQEQYADYKKLLGKDAPKSFGEFQQVKYFDAEKYAEWKKKAAEKRNVKQLAEKAAERKKSSVPNNNTVNPPKSVAKQKKTPRNYATPLANSVGKAYYDEVMDMLDACPNENVRTMYQRLMSKIHIGKVNEPDAYEEDGRIFFSMKETHVDNQFEKKFSVLFHELGHGCDNVSGSRFAYYSETWQGGRFGKQIRRDADAWVQREYTRLNNELKAHQVDIPWLQSHGYLSSPGETMLRQYAANHGVPFEDILTGKHIPSGFHSQFVPRVTRDHAYAAVAKEVNQVLGGKNGALAGASLADIMQGATNDRLQFVFGHEKGYFNEIDVAIEAFAEMSEAYVSTPEALPVLRKYLPNAMNAFDEMIRDLVGGL